MKAKDRNKYPSVMARKSFHKLDFKNDYGAMFSLCGKVSYEQDRLNGTGPLIGPSIPFSHAENQCIRCYRIQKDVKP